MTALTDYQQNLAVGTEMTSKIKEEVDEIVNQLEDKLSTLCRTIWENPEIGQQEFKSHDTICDFMESLGYTVTRHAYGLPTAFEVLSGSGGRLVNFNAEYDSLPGIGHACGHNLITTSSVTAFLTLAKTIEKLGIEGRVQLLGTPDEEGEGGKPKLIAAGAYKGVDVSLMAHPFEGCDSGDGNYYPDGIAGFRMVGRQKFTAEYFGKPAHAGSNPWDGVNALDAVVSAYNNLALLRQQIQSTERIHNVFIESDKVVNIIPAYAKATYHVRSAKLRGLRALEAKVKKIVEAAALATGCEVKMEG
ncbi:Amidohydrolase [Ascosphaera apis ARSEF 7405]|uniref:Amidohydrolase n=1 Tax=Ascosphaera apis ARSEF 7405 TaxID=392613 RepID=A0A167XNJ8_9EURO|nr:Amidohydrolase [Ascosphaera apis ARSEF 7405]